MSRATYLLKVSRWAAEPNKEESYEFYAAHRARRGRFASVPRSWVDDGPRRVALQHLMKTLHLRPRLLLDSCDRRASVATVETELVARAPSQLRRPRDSPFRPRACLCARIAIFRIAPGSLERARSAQTPLRPCSARAGRVQQAWDEPRAGTGRRTAAAVRLMRPIRGDGGGRRATPCTGTSCLGECLGYNVTEYRGTPHGCANTVTTAVTGLG